MLSLFRSSGRQKVWFIKFVSTDDLYLLIKLGSLKLEIVSYSQATCTYGILNYGWR